MKKILLASTILVGTAGFAAADNKNFTWSGEAYAGVAWSSVDTTNPLLTPSTSSFTPEVTASFTAGMKTTTDGGLEAGATIKIKAMGVSMEKDHTDAAFGTYSWTGTGDIPEGSISDASVYLSGDFGKFEVVYDADGSSAAVYDVNFKYSNTWGDFKVEAYYTFSPKATPPAGTNGDMGLKLSYTMADYTFYVQPEWDESDGATGDWQVGFGASATMSGFTGAIDVDYENAIADWDWKASVKYATGPYSIGAFAEDDDAVDNIDFGVNAAYDLGGGVKLEAQYVWDDDSGVAGESLFAVGVSMKF
jgi:outer membrane protein OmpU